MDDFKSFGEHIIREKKKISDRAIAFLYFHTVIERKPVTIRQLATDFVIVGLPRPNITILQRIMTNDKRTFKCNGKLLLRSDRIRGVEIDLNLTPIKSQTKPPIKVAEKRRKDNNQFIDDSRIAELKKIKTKKFDFSRLNQMLKELNDAFVAENWISVILLVRSIIDHVPPIFTCKNFSEIANNYKGAKSFKDSMSHLDKSSRKIADSYLHIQIRKKEVLPNRTQVNFSNDIDVLLAEIIRIF